MRRRGDAAPGLANSSVRPETRANNERRAPARPQVLVWSAASKKGRPNPESDLKGPDRGWRFSPRRPLIPVAENDTTSGLGVFEEGLLSSGMDLATWLTRDQTVSGPRMEL